MIVTKPVDLARLQQELTAAGVVVNGLGMHGDDLYTYDADGVPEDLPPEAQPIVDAHDATVTARTADFATAEDAERLAIINERAQTDPAFAALADLTLGTKGVQT